MEPPEGFGFQSNMTMVSQTPSKTLNKYNRHNYRPFYKPFLASYTARLAGCVAGLVLFAATAGASPPWPYAATYEARYGGFKANAERSLSNTEDGGIRMQTTLELKLLGQTISRIREDSSLVIDSASGEFRPLAYTFEQTGLGSRSRSVTFDWDNATATTITGRQENTIPLEGAAMDNLSGYLALRDQLLAGRRDVSFLGIDKGKLEEFHYRVIGEESVDTSAGRFQALKLERVRDDASHRTTEIWLAPNWDYLLIKLVQKEPGSNTISLELTQATVDGQEVAAKEDG